MKVLNSYEFIYELAEDAKEKTFEWENTTISEYLESIVGWIEDTDEKSLYPVEWDKKDLKLFGNVKFLSVYCTKSNLDKSKKLNFQYFGTAVKIEI